ncbi:MAG: ATP phosphoribosyltransferase regulatory subunit [Magnetospiraceae bacterium]
MQNALLPNGLQDSLPPDAAFEAAVEADILSTFAASGYDRVSPPLAEFEESLLTGQGAATAQQTFRLMDPISQRMMGVRPDMTVQVARIAATRLSRVPRPLRLSYAGPVLRVRGSQLRPERQFSQAGAELIGAATPEADAEVIALAVEALDRVGVKGLSVDLGMPVLVPTFLSALGAEGVDPAEVRVALDRKDSAAIAALPAAVSEILLPLLNAAGPLNRALPLLTALALPPDAQEACATLTTTAALLRKHLPKLAITIDPVENRGYEYHTGATYTVFALGARGELGRGGRYTVGGEPAAGITLFMDSVLRAVPEPKPTQKLFLPYGTPREDGEALRQQGWCTVAQLDAAKDPAKEARQLKCSHLLQKGAPVALSETSSGSEA